jgi:hypothetical protein
VYGFVPVELGDFELAKFLRDHRAIDTRQRIGNSNVWRGPDGGPAVAVALYGGPGGLDVKLFIREDLAPGAPRGKPPGRIFRRD